MANIKLSDYCKKNGISYITGYRWFKDGKLPVKASQTDSGTILVEDDAPSIASTADSSMDATSLFFKKTLEFSLNNSSIEDFAAYIFSNFQLKLLPQNEPGPKYSKIKPKPEDVQEYYKKILDKTSAHAKDKPKPNMYIPDPETWESISNIAGSFSRLETIDNPGHLSADGIQNNYSAELNYPSKLNVDPLGETQINLLSSFLGGEQTFGTSYTCADVCGEGLPDITGTQCGINLNANYFVSSPVAEVAFEIESPLDNAIIDKPKRGRPKKIIRTE